MPKQERVLFGIILDVSGSMKKNWNNRDSKKMRFDVVKDILNEQLWKLSSLGDVGKDTNIEIFCLGMGFQKPVTYLKVDSEDRKKNETLENQIVINHSNLVCDLLALTESIPTKVELNSLETSLNRKWNLYADSVLAKIKAQISEEIQRELRDFIQKGIEESARVALYNSWHYKLYTLLERITVTQRWNLFRKILLNQTKFVADWESKIRDACLAESVKFINRIQLETERFFETKKVQYADVIQGMLRNFAASQIQIVLELLTAGHSIERSLSCFDEEKAFDIATSVYEYLNKDIKEHLQLPTIKNLGVFLKNIHFELHASLSQKELRSLTEKYIRRYAWDMLEPFVQNAVFDIIKGVFNEIVNKMVLYWISIASSREVILPLEKVRGILPDITGDEVLYKNYMFGTTPVKEALNLASLTYGSLIFETRKRESSKLGGCPNPLPSFPNALMIFPC